MNFTTLPGLIEVIQSNFSHRNMMNFRKNDAYKALSTRKVYATVRNLALGLRKEGVKEKESIGIIAQPSPFWVIADLAIMSVGCVTVPIFKRISAESLAHETNDSNMRYIFVGLEEELEAVRSHGKGIKKIIPIGIEAEGNDILPFQKLLHEGEEEAQDRPSSFEAMVKNVKEDDLATIIYTSGSTGLPKGVELTHKNIVSQIEAAGKRFVLDAAKDTAFSSLPLAHIFERMVMYYYLSTGTPVYFVDDISNIGKLIKIVKPTVMTVVPRLLEKVLTKIRDKVDESTGWKKRLAVKAMIRAESKPPEEPFRGFMDFVFQKLVYKQFKQALGGNLDIVISGAAALPKDVGSFFINIGIPIYEGYGMTEASPVIAANYPGNTKLGTVGKAFPGVEIKIGDDGEVMARGPNVMRGYHNRKEETEKTLKADGFLHTGDLGSMDDEGYLSITGRKKDLFKKSTGEYVAPVPIEQKITRNKYVDTAIIIADQRKFVSALIFPDFDACIELQKKLDKQMVSQEEFVRSDDFKKEINQHIQKINKTLHHTEEIQIFLVIPETPSVESGDLTPTMKVRRHKLEDKYKSEIDSLYKGGN
ncbi:MAG: AMP-dependent synthetase/ligase [Spirochaetia bacterium]